MAPVTE
jgi:hypothetical protein